MISAKNASKKLHLIGNESDLRYWSDENNDINTQLLASLIAEASKETGLSLKAVKNDVLIKNRFMNYSRLPCLVVSRSKERDVYYSLLLTIRRSSMFNSICISPAWYGDSLKREDPDVIKTFNLALDKLSERFSEINKEKYEED